jgi:HEAT repeat protein
LNLLEYGTPEEQVDAASWLADHKERRAVPLLVQWLRGRDEERWAEAATALAKIGDPAAIVPLVNALEAATESWTPGANYARRTIVRALHRLTGLRFGRDLERWKQVRDRITRSS